MSTHTPGPWSVEVGQPNDGRNSAVYAGIHSPTYVVADVYRDVEELESEAPANASLIAAAPELLAALKELVDWHGGVHAGDCPEDDTCDCAGAPINARVNAAIAKAEGR